MSDPARFDGILLGVVDDAVAAAAATAGDHLTCGLGCTACCMGPFEISAADAWRLRQGLSELAAAYPRAAAAVAVRARAQWDRWRDEFPGSAAEGTFGDDEDERVAFCDARADEACAALDPASGACVLYAHRPLACRTYGLPLRTEGELVAACELNFTDATSEAVAAAALEPCGVEEEARLERALASAGARVGDSVVAAVLALAGERG